MTLNKNLLPLGAFALLSLAACTSAMSNNVPSGDYSSSSSEGFIWASSMSSSDSSSSDAQAYTGPGCKIGGCSAQLCVSDTSEDIISTCEWTDAYGCYEGARCEKQSNGSCGWSQTAELTACLADPPSRS